MNMEKRKRLDCVDKTCGPCIWSRPFLCLCFPPTRESHSARGVYTAIFSVVLILACISHEMEIHDTVKETVGTSRYNETCLRLGAGRNCERVTGFLGVYRLCAVLFFFHTFMALITIRVHNSQSTAANIHNGFWLFKLLVLALFWAGLYIIPDTPALINVWKFAGIIFSFIFVLLQQISLIDCAYALNNYLGAQSVRSCLYSVALYGLTVGILAADIVGYTFLWRLYTSVGDNFRLCLANFVVLVINGALAVGLCLASFFVVRKGMHMWLQGPFMVTYTLYLTWAAMSNQPPITVPKTLLPSNHPRLRLNEQNETIYYCRPIGGKLDQLIGENWSHHIMIYAGILIMVVFALYSSLTTSKEHEKFGIRKSRSNLRSLASHHSHMSLHGSQYSLSNYHASTPPISVPASSVALPGPPPRPQPSSTSNLPGAPLRRPTSTSSTPGYPLVDVGYPRRAPPTPVDKRLERVRRSEDALLGRRRSHSTSSATQDVPISFLGAEGDTDRKFEKAAAQQGRGKRPKRLKRSSTFEVRGSAQSLVVLPPPRDEWLVRDEFYYTRYNYCFFHVIFALASLFVMSHLTNWLNPIGSHLGAVGTTWMTVWFKIACCWSAFLLFGWSLMCSRFGCGRDLVELHRETLTRNKQLRLSRDQLRRGRSRTSSQGLRSPDREAVLASPTEEEEPDEYDGRIIPENEELAGSRA